MTPQDKYTMLVEVEVECKRCSTKQTVHVPVSCTPEIQVSGETLMCDIEGRVEDHLPKCTCGENDYKITKEEIEEIKPAEQENEPEEETQEEAEEKKEKKDKVYG